ncbi:hypothetical protein BH23BAC1_BH23BAC1_32820 [soil metagenome]
MKKLLHFYRLPIDYLQITILSLFIFLFLGCNSLRETSKYEFQSARYYTSIIPSESNKVYVNVEEGTISIHNIEVKEGREEIVEIPNLIFTENKFQERELFHNPSFDIDFLTVPIKFLFARQDVPNQLTTNFQGVVYIGYRNDFYNVSYRNHPINGPERRIRHIGSSIGLFGGIGATAINPWVTQDAVQIEYDGVIFSRGLAWIVGFNHINVGIAVGLDYLLDRNRTVWIYQNRPWIGTAIGFNLN